MSADDKVNLLIGATIAFVCAFIFVLSFLGAMFQREAVKRDLCERGCQPLHIWWRPMAYWAPMYLNTPFRVIYRDVEGRLHKAYCRVYTFGSDSPLGRRRVEWIKDELRDFIDV